MTTESAWASLLSELNRLHHLGTIGQLLGWDEQVNLPDDSAGQRAEQQSVLAETQHQFAASSRLGGLLDALEGGGGDLSDAQNAVVREARKNHDRATKLPASLVREKAAQESAGYHAWARARSENDFAAYVPVLEKNLELARREADCLGWGDRAYDYMIDLHDPGMTADAIANLFGELKTGLVPLVQKITGSVVKPRADILKGFPVGAQSDFLRNVTEKLGFNYRRGRIDVSLHPFCSGTGADIRMTTRFQEDIPLDSLFSAIHEAGHGLYEQGLPMGHHATVLGQAAGMGVHESQSRLWENQVGRSRGFWQYFEPKFREAFPEQTAALDSNGLYLAINAVNPTLIRVDSDEVTYNLHIILRFEIERRLFDGSLAVKDLSEAWNALSTELIGLTPSSDREGVLQDVHWSSGAFGYFPSYCLGNMLAAQLWYRVTALRPDLEEDFACGDFSWLLNWLHENVHAHGKRYQLPELTRIATSEDLSPRALLRYLGERYLPLYCG